MNYPAEHDGRPVALMLSPHPDDEVIPAGGTLLLLRDAGWRVVNLACGLGRPDQHPRRRRELAEACRRAEFELLIHDPPLPLSRTDDLLASESALAATVTALLDDLGPALVLAPQVHDCHHAHEAVGRAVRGAAAGRRVPTVVWWWSLWADLARPTLIAPIDSVLGRMLDALAAHGGENARNDYPRLVRCRAAANSVLGPERTFGFGAPGLGDRHVELLTETITVNGASAFGRPRRLDPRAPAPACPEESAGAPADAWLLA